jgi:hypothetical protein
VKDWSDREIARLRPSWMQEFLRGHVCRCAFLVLLYLVALGFLGASFERYWYWIGQVEAVASEPVKTINQRKAFCIVKPWTKACTPTPANASPAPARSAKSRPLVAAPVLPPPAEAVVTSPALDLRETPARPELIHAQAFERGAS